ncbi:glycogen debranching protein [Deinococcus irradiatisoli]|uniref:Glycogen debranching protein n=1 Tax=Deinococcus irradiatisoli TaxID=2202254 RepID=A0A2Z3JI87_9DEIO|nr:amylo-alpha-1,6-glucosidase [Deinococcus irradiatisoli]AWN23716.1 glycogen debranching protein [Deinococcus irradiatisoli]
MPEPVARHVHRLGPEAARDLSREVLLPDGLGGFALSSPAGVPTRCYSGLCAAHRPPGDRRVMFVTALEQLRVGEQRCDLHAFEVAPGTLEGQGLSVLSGVTLRDLLPEREQLALGLQVRRRSFMPQQSGALVLLYEIEAPFLSAAEPASFTLGALMVDRDMHHVHTETPDLNFECLGREVRVHGAAHRTRLRLHTDLGVTPLAARPWPQRLHYRLDTARGAPDTDRVQRADFWEVQLRPGLNRLALVVEGLDVPVDDPWAAHDEEAQRRADLVDQAWAASGVRDEVVATLSVAADAFLVHRESTGSLSVIAGYPWFADWGRDSMIALPGLTLSTGRTAQAQAILETFIQSLRGGLTPNNFHDDGQGAGYNTVDGSLWLAAALEQVVQRTEHAGLARRALTTIRGILTDYTRGTAHGIGMDNADGLLLAGQSGVQLTWMDVKIHDWVVTPRHGKPVEIQALWIAALSAEARLSDALGEPAEFGGVLRAARQAFAAFWNPETNYFNDYLAGSGVNAQIRPNALLALSLPDTPVRTPHLEAALKVAARDLLTPLGLRTLSPRDPQYLDNYGGDRLVRDAAYHQGTVWPWLIGPYTGVLLRLGRLGEAQAALDGLRGHLWEAGVGSVSEVVSAGTLTPGGCPFQAWSVAEVLRAHIALSLAEGERPADQGAAVRPSGQPAAPAARASVAAPEPERPATTRRRRSGSLPESGPGSAPGATTFGDTGLSVGGGLLGLSTLPGPLPDVRLASIPEPLPGPLKESRKKAAEPPASPAPEPASLSEVLDLTLPELTWFQPPPENTPGKPLEPDPPLSVEDPDVIEPLT